VFRSGPVSVWAFANRDAPGSKAKINRVVEKQNALKTALFFPAVFVFSFNKKLLINNSFAHKR
jgi:hypothetical protein